MALLIVYRALIKHLLLGFLLFAGAVFPAAADNLEQKLKAAFLYRFAQFVEWPAQDSSREELALCILGDEGFYRTAAAIEGKQVGEARLVIKRIEKPSQVGECQMVFTGKLGKTLQAQALKQSRNAHVLTVSDQPGFAAAGGMIELMQVDNRLQFEINLKAARQANLQVSAQLLRLARTVHGSATE